MAQRDYYEILGVERTVDAAVLKSAYRKLAMEHHPDRNGGSEESVARFKEISEAYTVLSDEQKRAAYDRFGHAGVGGGAGGGNPFGQGGGQGFHDINDIFSQVFGDAFGDAFGGRGGGRQQQSGPRRGSDLRYDLEITLEQAYKGAEVEIAIPTLMTCEVCDGSGAKAGTKPTICSTCGGAGRVRQANGFFQVERTCPRCGGSGEVIADPCTTCRGHGQVRKTRKLSLKVPAGVDDGSRIRLSGEGEAGQRGGPRGDLYVFLSVLPHELFERGRRRPLPDLRGLRRQVQGGGRGACGRPDRQDRPHQGQGDAALERARARRSGGRAVRGDADRSDRASEGAAVRTGRLPGRNPDAPQHQFRGQGQAFLGRHPGRRRR